MTDAKIIADSITQRGDRLTTMEVRLHRFVLAEFNTHRWFSRNSASSRAIPVAKQIDRVLNDTAYPVKWPEEQKGMQGGEAWEDPGTIEGFKDFWTESRDAAVSAAADLHAAGVHKSVTNRLLEPFMWHTIIVTSTEWENFFEQRCSPLAQPEIRLAADMMHSAYRDSIPQEVSEGQWHLPYVEDEDFKAITLTLPFTRHIHHDVIMQAIRAAAPDIPTSCATGEVAAFIAALQAGDPPDLPDGAVALQIPPSFGDVALVTAESVAAAHALGAEVHVWTINDVDEARRLLGLGCDGIMTDVPHRVRPAITARRVPA